MTKIYGEALRSQVEDRLAFLTEGKQPRKNIDVMKSALMNVQEEAATNTKTEKKSKKVKEFDIAVEAATGDDADGKFEKKNKKEKKEKKIKKSALEQSAGDTAEVEAEMPKKKRKKTEA